MNILINKKFIYAFMMAIAVLAMPDSASAGFAFGEKLCRIKECFLGGQVLGTSTWLNSYNCNYLPWYWCLFR